MHTLVFLLGVEPARGLLDVPCYAVYVCLHALVISAGVKVLKHRGNSRQRERVGSAMACMVRETGPHFFGFVACIVAAWALLFLWQRWPFRLTHVELAVSEVHFLEALSDGPGREGYASAMAGLDAAFVVNLVLLFAAFELALLLGRLSFFRRRGLAGTAAAGALAVALFVLFFPAYAKGRGFLRSRRFLKHPCEVVIRYNEWDNCFGTGRDYMISISEEQCSVGKEEPPAGVFVPASREEMLGLLGILADGGFFEMERILHPCDTIGAWRMLEVTDGVVRHLVCSCDGTLRGRRFDALAGKLRQAMGL